MFVRGMSQEFGDQASVYAAEMKAEAINGEAMLLLTEENLKELGMKMGHRKVLQRRIQWLQSPPAAAASATPSELVAPAASASSAALQRSAPCVAELPQNAQLPGNQTLSSRPHPLVPASSWHIPPSQPLPAPAAVPWAAQEHDVSGGGMHRDLELVGSEYLSGAGNRCRLESLEPEEGSLEPLDSEWLGGGGSGWLPVDWDDLGPMAGDISDLSAMTLDKAHILQEAAQSVPGAGAARGGAAGGSGGDEADFFPSLLMGSPFLGGGAEPMAPMVLITPQMMMQSSADSADKASFFSSAAQDIAVSGAPRPVSLGAVGGGGGGGGGGSVQPT